MQDEDDLGGMLARTSDNVEEREYEEGLVFVGMPFTGEGMPEVYSAVKDECEKLGLEAVRVDENVGSGLIIEEIATFIEDAEFIVFDLPHERPNVYYELGYAHGVGNEPLDILLIAREGTKVHFDISPYRIQFYKSTEQLRQLVARNLRA
jgi:hypothetical protein